MSNMRQKVSYFEYTGIGCRVPKDVTHVRFHPSVTEIESFTNPFNECRNSLRQVTFNEGLHWIGNSAFYHCRLLESITLPSTITIIGGYAFEGCIKLNEVVLNEGLKTIDSFAFEGCKSLTSIKLPSTVTNIENEAFINCWSLEEVVLNNGLTKIGQGSFYGCRSLENISIPPSVTKIGNRAFQVTRLREVTLNEGLKKLGSEVFPDTLERLTHISISTRLSNVVSTYRLEVEAKVDTIIDRAFPGSMAPNPNPGVWRPISRRGNVLRTGAVIQGIYWPMVKRTLDQIAGLITYYEIKEATTLFELALWKARITQAEFSSTADRWVYRIEVPGPVKDVILQYL